MKSFFWKFVDLLWCPCALAAWVTGGCRHELTGAASPGGFKLGTDLVGGTILVYEIDLRKSARDSDSNSAKKGKKDDKRSDAKARDRRFDPVGDITVLAEALKRRIDPNNLKNITIRPSGGEGRVEIVLPTGGTHRAPDRKAQEKWQEAAGQGGAEEYALWPQEAHRGGSRPHPRIGRAMCSSRQVRRDLEKAAVQASRRRGSG